MNIDDTAYRIVTKALAISPAFLTYSCEQFGLGDIEGLDDDTIHKVYDSAIPFVLDELKTMGILLNEGFEIYDSYENLNFILTLRERFDVDRLLTLFINSESTINTYQYILDADGIPNLVITDIIDSSYEMFPLSIDWGVLHEKKYDVVNTINFITYISDCIEKAKSDKENREIDSDHILAFSNYLIAHKKEVIGYAEKLINHPNVPVGKSDFNYEYIDGLSLLDGNEIEQFLLNIEAGSNIITIPSVDLHHSAHEYYFQYYVVESITEPSDLQLCKLVIEHVTNKTSEENISMFKDLCGIAKFADSTTDKLLEYVAIVMQ